MNITQEELEQLMADSAQNAIELTKEQFDIDLDETSSSIAIVDDVLLRFIYRYKDQALEDNMVFTLCNVYGAYIGEIFRREIGGIWHYEVSDPHSPHVLLEYAGHSYAFAGICYQRLVNDSQISVLQYYQQAISNHRQSSAH